MKQILLTIPAGIISLVVLMAAAQAVTLTEGTVLSPSSWNYSYVVNNTIEVECLEVYNNSIVICGLMPQNQLVQQITPSGSAGSTYCSGSNQCVLTQPDSNVNLIFSPNPSPGGDSSGGGGLSNTTTGLNTGTTTPTQQEKELNIALLLIVFFFALVVLLVILGSKRWILSLIIAAIVTAVLYFAGVF